MTPPFWFEANQLFKEINNDETWRELRELYPEYRNAKLVQYWEHNNRMNFGFRREHKGKLTLGEWLDQHKGIK